MANKKGRQSGITHVRSNSAQINNEALSSQEGRAGLSVRAASYSGPILPEQLEAYERSEAGRLYVRALIKQSEHRMMLENVVVRGDDRRANRGQWFAFIVALLFCATGGFLVHGGHDAAGGTIATASVVGLVSVFVTGVYQRKSERIEKAKIMAGQQEANADPPSNNEGTTRELPAE